MTSRQSERFRKLLIDQLTALYRGVHSDIRDTMIEQLFDQDEPRDEADESQRLQLDDLRLHLAETDALKAQMIEEALRRLQRDEFGDCVDCGNAIGTERLQAVPWTARCVECQETVESEGRQHAPTL